MSKKSSSPSASGASLALMYVGPPVRDPFPLRRGAVFSGGLPAMLRGRLGADPDFAALFLPLQEAGKALRELEQGRGALLKQAKNVAARAAGRK